MATPSETTLPRGPHISTKPMTMYNWYKHIDWKNATGIVIIPLIGIYLSLYTPLHLYTAIWSFIYLIWTGLGITAGYHRLWSHRCYSASLPLRVFLACMGAGAVQGSIRWWSRGHRAHHRYTDTEKDPYAVTKGLWHAHMGWLLFKQDSKKLGRADSSDLDEDWLVMWQHKNWALLALVFGIMVPAMVAGLWGDWKGGAVYAGIIRFFVVQQGTFCINSVAHYLGDQPFDDRRSPRDHMLTAFITLGEGYHNFHHEFPTDYRNGISLHHLDPTKWSIYMWSLLSLAHSLKQIRSNEIEKARLQQLQKFLDTRRSALDWGTPLSELPVLSWDEFTSRCKEGGEKLISVAGVVHDVGGFVEEHPGGRGMIMAWVGKDATAVFNGGGYEHSNAAHNLLGTMRVGVLRGGQEVEIWKRSGAGDKAHMQ